MSSRLVDVTYDADDPLTLGRFWAEALGREVLEVDGAVLAAGDDTQLGLRFVPRDPSRDGTPRMHLHVTSEGSAQQRVVDRLLSLGATHLDVGQLPEEDHVVLADPEGNALCVIPPDNGFLRGCGPLGELACDGSRSVGLFWSAALDWPLVWDEGGETAVQSPAGGTKVAWGGEPLMARDGAEPQRFHVETTDAVEHESDRLLALGATWVDRGAEGVRLRDPGGNEFELRARPSS